MHLMNSCVYTCTMLTVAKNFQVITKIESNLRLMSVDKFCPIYKALTFLNNEVRTLCMHTQYVCLMRLYMTIHTHGAYNILPPDLQPVAHFKTGQLGLKPASQLQSGLVINAYLRPAHA